MLIQESQDIPFFMDMIVKPCKLQSIASAFFNFQELWERFWCQYHWSYTHRPILIQSVASHDCFELIEGMLYVL